MKAEDLLDAIGNIPEAWVLDAEQAGKTVPVWLKWGSVAACLCCILLFGTMGLFRISRLGAAASPTTLSPSASISSPSPTIPQQQVTAMREKVYGADGADEIDEAIKDAFVAWLQENPDFFSTYVNDEKNWSMSAQQDQQGTEQVSMACYGPADEDGTGELCWLIYADGLVRLGSIDTYEETPEQQASANELLPEETPTQTPIQTPNETDSAVSTAEIESTSESYSGLFADLPVPVDVAAAADYRQSYWGELTAMDLVLEVPEKFFEDATSNEEMPTLFALYDSISRESDAAEGDGEVWRIQTWAVEDFIAECGISLEEWTQVDFQDNQLLLGKDDEYVYLLSMPLAMEYDPDNQDSVNSYYRHRLYGYAMLCNFLSRNEIEPAPDWEKQYLQGLRDLSLETGDFFTTEFGVGSIESEEPLLTVAAASIPNLSGYYTGETEEMLTWEDLLLYRLLHADYSAAVANQEELQEKYQDLFFPLDAAVLENRVWDVEFATEADVFCALFSEIMESGHVADYCAMTNWTVALEGMDWILYAESAAERVVIASATSLELAAMG